MTRGGTTAGGTHEAHAGWLACSSIAWYLRFGSVGVNPSLIAKMVRAEELIGPAMRSYQPRRPALFEPKRIVLAKGSLATPYARGLAEAICDLYPGADVAPMLDKPHNRIECGATPLIERHYEGKQTLVLGEHCSAVRLSNETDNTCPNYWHFSPTGFCPYDCTYCYLAGTPGVRFSPTVKIFMNLPSILEEIDRATQTASQPIAFYLGKLQDALALDPLTGYSRILVPFFAQHSVARQILLTKSADIDNLLGLDHQGRTIVSWSLNPPEVTALFESNTPDPRERIVAMARCANDGYPVRAVIMPIIPISKWADAYTTFLRELLGQVPLERITLGGICSYPSARSLMEAKLGPEQPISAALRRETQQSPDGRSRYPRDERIEIYQRIIDTIRSTRPDLPIALCLEERQVFEVLELEAAIGRCNCVL